MRFVRRTRYAFVRTLDDGSLVAAAVLAGAETPLADDQLQTFRSIPAHRWVLATEAGPAEVVIDLAERGLIVTDDPDPRLVELRRRDETLGAPAWNRYAALYDSMTHWSGVHSVLKPTLERKSTGFWPPPPHFNPVPEALDSVELPVTERTGGIFDSLMRRKTWRGFDQQLPLRLEELSVILRYVWGCHGTKEIVADELTILKKTSASGGSQHPGEVYPVLSEVEGVEPGIYHYDVEHHALELMERLSSSEAHAVAYAMSADQEHCRLAPALFIMTARYGRNYWKYPAHDKAFRTILIDAGHLSQTFYLTCTELGLGAFVTGAINDADIADRLQLKAFSEGVILLLGCGHPVPRNEPEFVPYRPARA